MDIANNDILMIDIDNMIHNKKKITARKKE